MDKIHSIRQLYYEQGKTIPEIIAETGHDRKTITKYLDMTDFNAPEPVTPDPEGICPKLESYNSLIDTWLMEDKKVPRKQRHTARRVYRRLGKEVDGFDCSYWLVAQYVAIHNEYSDAIVHFFRKFRAPFSGKAEHDFPEQSVGHA